MLYEVQQTFYLLLPLLGGAIVTGLCIKFNWLPSLLKPLDFNLTFRKRRLFGKNKTIRGLVFLPIGTALLFMLQAMVFHNTPSLKALELFDYSSVNPILFGLAIGVGAILSELPNSFMKRQLDVSAGSSAKGFWLPVFYVIDQIDILAGIWLVLSLVMTVTIKLVLISIVLVFVIHQIITIIGYFLGMRKTIR
jgi:hypothetical protein